MKSFIMIACLLCPSWAMAGMTVDADRFELVQEEQRADFFGHVVVIRDDMTLKADKMKVWYQQDKKSGKKTLKRVHAMGQVVIDTPDSKGAAESAVFVTDSDTLDMTGKAHMTSKQGTVEGEHIAYNIKTKNTKVVGSDAGEQVRFIFEDKLQ